MTIEEIVADMNSQIASAPLARAESGELVEECGYSRTGWAVVRADGQCTCKPALPPEPTMETP